MTLREFKESLHGAAPPAGLPPALVAMWHDAKGDWHKAHETAQDIKSAAGAWVHAYLHRKEGDHPNARYWYREAAKEVARDALEHEWERIVEAMLAEMA